MKSFNKISTKDQEELIKSLGEDKAISLLKYCYKSMELFHREEKSIIEICSTQKILNFVNTAFKDYYTAGIMRTAFERGDLYDKA